MTRFATTLTLCMLVAATAHAQTAASKMPTSDGTVISVTRTTLLIRMGPDDYKVFVIDADTTRPPQIPTGAWVSVASRTSDDPSTPFATQVRVLALPTYLPAGTPAPPDDPVPTSVRRLEQSVKRQTQRYRIGARSGATLDEELFSLGAHVQVGPFFGDRIWARPNLELGFGEVTTLVGLNFEGIYRMPVTQNEGRYAVYFGGGPGLNFIDWGAEALDRNLDDSRFDNFNLDVGFNILMGVQVRNGLFLELKSAAYSAPHIRFIIGYNF